MSTDDQPQDGTSPAADAENAYWQAFWFDLDRNGWALREGLAPLDLMDLAVAKHEANQESVRRVTEVDPVAEAHDAQYDRYR